MPILVYSGFGTSNMLTAGRNLGSITTGIDRFVLTYSLCPLLTRTVPRLLREKKTHDQHFERGQPNCHALRLFLFFFLYFFIQRAASGKTHLVYKNPNFLSPKFFFHTQRMTDG